MERVDNVKETPTLIVCTVIDHVCPQSNQSVSQHCLCILDSSYLQGKLRALVFLSKDHGGHKSESGPPNLGVVVRMGDIELSDEGHQERLHLDHAIQKALLSVPGRLGDTKNNARDSPSDTAHNTSGERRAG